MFMKMLIISTAACLLGLVSTAQKIIISGYIKDITTQEVLIGASIIDANKKTGTATNQYGFFLNRICLRYC